MLEVVEKPIELKCEYKESELEIEMKKGFRSWHRKVASRMASFGSKHWHWHWSETMDYGHEHKRREH